MRHKSLFLRFFFSKPIHVVVLLLGCIIVITAYATNWLPYNLGISDEEKQHEPEFENQDEVEAIREQFFRQRAYPFDSIPADARRQAWESRPEDWVATDLRNRTATTTPTVWHSVGPMPTNNYGNLGAVTGRVQAIAVSPSNPQLVLIGAAVGGIWRSTDGGLNFVPVTDDQVDIAVGGIAFAPSNPSIVYAGMGNQYERFLGSGILMSTDAGQTWFHPNNTSLPSGITAKLAVDSTNPSRVYIAQALELVSNGFFTGGGFYYSNDGGVNWTKSFAGTIRDLAIHPTRPQTLYICNRYTNGAQVAGLYKSIDGGATWSISFASPYATNNLDVIHTVISAASPDKVFALANGSVSGVMDFRTMVSNDNGQTWNNLGSGGMSGLNGFSYVIAAAADPIESNTIYAGYNELWKSTNGGANWTSLTHGYTLGGPYLVHVDMHSFAFSPLDHNKFYVGSDGGLWKSGDGGLSFQNLNATLSVTTFTSITVHPTNPLLTFGGAQDNGFQKRLGNSMMWDYRGSGDSGSTVINPLNTSMLFNYNGSINRFLNNGDTYDGNVSPPPEPDGRRLGYAPFTGNGVDSTLYLGTWRLWVTTNLGSSWFNPSGTFDVTRGNGDVISAIGVSQSNPQVIYTGSTRSRVMASINGGVAWTDISVGIPDRWINSITVDKTNPAIAYLTVSGYRTGHVFKTTNTGATWTDVSGNLPDIPTNALLIDPLNSNTIYAGTDIGVFRSTTGGNTWVTFNSGMPPAVVLNFTSQTNGLIQVGTYGRGAYEMTTNPSCSYSLSATNRSFDATGGDSTVNVTCGAGCNWVAESNVSWLSVTSGITGVDNGTVGFTVGANAVTSTRTGTITIADQLFTVVQTGSSSLNFQLPRDFSTAGVLFENYGTGSAVAMTFAGTMSNANGSVTSTGPGYRSVNFYPYIMFDQARNYVLMHPGAGNDVSRGASIGYRASQSGVFNISGAFARQNDAQGAGNGVTVMVFKNLNDATPLFTSNIGSNNAVNPNDPFSGTGVAPLNLSVTLAANDVLRFVVFSGTPRVDASFDSTALQLTIAPTCNFSVTGTNQSFPANGGTGSVPVTAGTNCNWTATSNDTGFLTITSANSGTANGTVNYTIAQNTTGNPRTGTMTIAGQTFTVNQSNSIATPTPTPPPFVTISGRIFASDGMTGLRNAGVTLTDPQGGVRTATTSSFGFYSFDNVAASGSYTIRVLSRRFRFSSQTVQPSGDLANIDFVGLE